MIAVYNDLSYLQITFNRLAPEQPVEITIKPRYLGLLNPIAMGRLYGRLKYLECAQGTA